MNYDIACAWCQKLKVGKEWLKIPYNIAEVSHGMCPECCKKFKEEMSGRSRPSQESVNGKEREEEPRTI